ncbi:hypothetical protein TRV_07517, partial [Trichophyton verrucosum HKI 0517]
AAKKKKSRKKSIGLKPLSNMVIVWVLAGRYYGDPVRRAGAHQIHDAVVYVVDEGYFPGWIGEEDETARWKMTWGPQHEVSLGYERLVEESYVGCGQKENCYVDLTRGRADADGVGDVGVAEADASVDAGAGAEDADVGAPAVLVA